jgi:colanic acid/amylovoran biosynthesis glycosyltransferase
MSCHDARLTMVGDGPLLEACKQMAIAMGITQAVEFTGPRSHPQVAELMRGARCFVQHSLKTSYGDSEGTPVAVLEASGAGLPVVSTRHGGIKDVVQHGETGYLVEEGDLTGMAQYMIKLADDPDLAAELGGKGRQHIAACYTMDKSIRGLEQVLDSAVSRRNGRPG